jgi:transposase-like protein
LGLRRSVLELGTSKWLCLGCSRSFWQRFLGILPRMRASGLLRRSICQKHFDGISRSRLGRREKISSATVERWFGAAATGRGARQCRVSANPRHR